MSLGGAALSADLGGSGLKDSVEAREIYESVFELILSRSNDHYFVADCIRLLENILIATINYIPLKMGTATIDSGFYYQRLIGFRLRGLSVKLDSMNATLPRYFRNSEAKLE